MSKLKKLRRERNGLAAAAVAASMPPSALKNQSQIAQQGQERDGAIVQGNLMLMQDEFIKEKFFRYKKTERQKDGMSFLQRMN